MAKVFIVSFERTDENGDIISIWITGVFKTLASARREIEKTRDEYRADDSIMITGEAWSLGDYPYYEASYFENYYLKMYDEKRMTGIKYTVEEHELAD